MDRLILLNRKILLVVAQKNRAAFSALLKNVFTLGFNNLFQTLEAVNDIYETLHLVTSFRHFLNDIF